MIKGQINHFFASAHNNAHQVSKSDLTYEQLSDYLKEQVGLNSIILNSKEETPQLLTSQAIQDTWKGWLAK